MRYAKSGRLDHAVQARLKHKSKAPASEESRRRPNS